MNLEQSDYQLEEANKRLEWLEEKEKSSSTCFITVGTGAPRIDGRAKMAIPMVPLVGGLLLVLQHSFYRLLGAGCV